MLKLFRKKTPAAPVDASGKPNGGASSSRDGGETAQSPLEQLRVAVEANNVAQVKKLASAHPPLVDTPLNEHGQTCLHLAAANGDVECLEVLLKYGDINATDAVGGTVLHASVDHLGAMLLLLKKKGCDANRLAMNRQSLLHVMARKATPINDELWTLLRKRLTSFNPVSVSGDTPLHVCCQTGHMTLAEYLLSYPGLSVNIQNKKDETPLHIAVEHDHLQMVKALLAAGASPSLQDAHGNTALDLAISTEVENALRDTLRFKSSAGLSLNGSSSNLSTSVGRDSPLSKSSSGPSINPVPHHHLHSSAGTYGSSYQSSSNTPQLMQKQNSTSMIARNISRPSPPASPTSMKRPSPHAYEPVEPFLLSSSAPNINPLLASSGGRDRSGSFSSAQAASHRLILMDEELTSTSSTPDPEEPALNNQEMQHMIDKLGTELVDELGHILDESFILDSLTKITRAKSFKWRSSYTRNKIEVLKYLVEFVSEEDQQGLLRHIKTKYPEAIKLSFVRTPSSKKLGKKERSQKKLTMVERKIKQYEWELMPDQFVLGDLIGTGSYGAVHHASLFPNGEDVAVKLLSGDVGVADAVTFMKEIAILSRLNHPNIVGFIGASITGSLALVMEYCAAGNLKSYLKNNHLTWRQKVRMARQSAEGVSYLHDQSPPIVHRDLKCQNILVTSEGDIRVSDFGLSKTISRTVGNPSKIGTLNWLAPEVLRGESHPGTAADVYAFGMVLYEILMDGTPPYDTWQPLQIVRAIDEGLVPDVPDTCDPLFKTLMLDCWASNPEARPSFNQICHRLQVIERKTIHRSGASSSGDSTPPTSPRSGSVTLISVRKKSEFESDRSSPASSPASEPRSSSLKLRPKP